MPFCEENEVGLIAREPLYCVLLTDKYTTETKFLKTDHRNRWMRDQYSTNLKKIDKIKTVFDANKITLKQAAIEFVLHENAVSVVIPGMKTVSHVKDHLQAVELPRLTLDELNQFHKLFQEEELFQTGFFRN